MPPKKTKERGAYPGSWNNPGNVKYSNKVTHKGQTGFKIGAKSGGKFLTFDTAQNGLNAMGSSIGQMVRKKIPGGEKNFTIANLITEYAPKKDGNDTEGYINFVSNRMKISQDAKLKLSDTDTMVKLMDTMIRRDSGHPNANWFTPSEYKTATGKMLVLQGDTKEARKANGSYDTPIPAKLRPSYDKWYSQLPKNLQYTGDYDLQGAWLDKLGQPDKYEKTQNGHLDDYGKKPNHPTFSSGSKWHDPTIPERTGGEWKKSSDGSWDFYPGTGNQMSDEELKQFFDKYEKGNRVHPRSPEATHAALEGGDTGGAPTQEQVPQEEPAAPAEGGPRIVINPAVFHDNRDALCVAMNEAFRVLMEELGFEPMSEPTEAQRRFFADTAYANDEVQLRRTILARICTFDTSIS